MNKQYFNYPKFFNSVFNAAIDTYRMKRRIILVWSNSYIELFFENRSKSIEHKITVIKKHAVENYIFPLFRTLTVNDDKFTIRLLSNFTLSRTLLNKG